MRLGLLFSGEKLIIKLGKIIKVDIKSFNFIIKINMAYNLRIFVWVN